MFALNLPEYPAKIRMKDGKHQIFDANRRRYVALTPEEWVRQHFVQYLIQQKQYPSQLLANEASIELYGQQRRCDTLLYDLQGQPQVIIEYKAPTVAINQAVFEQIMAYNWVLRASYLFVSNGLQHYACKMDYTTQSSQFLKEIPSYTEL